MSTLRWQSGMTHLFNKRSALCGAKSQALVIVGASCLTCTELWIAGIKRRGVESGLGSDPQWLQAIGSEEQRLERLKQGLAAAMAARPGAT